LTHIDSKCLFPHKIIKKYIQNLKYISRNRLKKFVFILIGLRFEIITKVNPASFPKVRNNLEKKGCFSPFLFVYYFITPLKNTLIGDGFPYRKKRKILLKKPFIPLVYNKLSLLPLSCQYFLKPVLMVVSEKPLRVGLGR
jgi:hypothetical protein